MTVHRLPPGTASSGLYLVRFDADVPIHVANYLQHVATLTEPPLLRGTSINCIVRCPRSVDELDRALRLLLPPGVEFDVCEIGDVA